MTRFFSTMVIIAAPFFGPSATAQTAQEIEHIDAVALLLSVSPICGYERSQDNLLKWIANNIPDAGQPHITRATIAATKSYDEQMLDMRYGDLLQFCQVMRPSYEQLGWINSK